MDFYWFQGWDFIGIGKTSFLNFFHWGIINSWEVGPKGTYLDWCGKEEGLGLVFILLFPFWVKEGCQVKFSLGTRLRSRVLGLLRN